jgi:hypothetical protein
MNLVAVRGDASRGGVDRERAEPDDVAAGLGHALCAAQESTHSGDELTRAERLRHVVVGPDPEPHLEIDLGVSCREHQDGQVAIGLDPPAHLETVEPRQHQVEDDEVGAKAPAELDSRVPVARDLDLESLGAQPGRDGRGDRRLVLHHRDSARVHGSKRTRRLPRRRADYVEIPCTSADLDWPPWPAPASHRARPARFTSAAPSPRS